MKKAIIILPIALLFIASTTFAIRWTSTKKLTEGDTQRITSTILNEERLDVVKFYDEGVTCYMAYTETTVSDGIQITLQPKDIALECLK